MSRLDPLTEPAELHRIIAAQAAELATAKAGLLVKALEVEKLRVELARLKRQQYGRSSEKLRHKIEQLELGLEELEIGAAASDATAGAPQPCVTAERASRMSRRARSAAGAGRCPSTWRAPRWCTRRPRAGARPAAAACAWSART